MVIKKAIFLDRDGVLVIPIFKNGRSYAPLELNDFKVFPDAKESIKKLKMLGFKIIVITNQPDIHDNILTKEIVDEMNLILKKKVDYDDIEVCYDKIASSPRRKPNPGMIYDSAQKWNINIKESYLIGDRFSDIEAGIKAGCKGNIFIDYNYTSETSPTKQDYSCSTLSEAANWIFEIEKT
tara:strand:- start:72 stop:614 length:543 start_codon:yes stop_codon:yes gene_type:complete